MREEFIKLNAVDEKVRKGSVTYDTKKIYMIQNVWSFTKAIS
jgi:hypothetical protein